MNSENRISMEEKQKYIQETGGECEGKTTTNFKKTNTKWYSQKNTAQKNQTCTITIQIRQPFKALNKKKKKKFEIN